jgi:hypothetical protein
MLACPACHADAIPMYRVFLSIPGVTHDCPHCQARLRPRASVLGNMLASASSCLCLPLASYLVAPPLVIVLFGFVLPLVAGISLWMNTVKVQVVEPEVAFTPHTRELKF